MKISIGNLIFDYDDLQLVEKVDYSVMIFFKNGNRAEIKSKSTEDNDKNYSFFLGVVQRVNQQLFPLPQPVTQATFDKLNKRPRKVH